MSQVQAKYDDSDILEEFAADYTRAEPEPISLSEYLTLCKKDPSAYATAAQRLVKAIGEPKLIDTRKVDPRLSRLHQNATIRQYETFSDFYGAEEAISQIVDTLKAAAQGLEEKKQIIYLLGPVGGGKSSLAERLKYLMQKEPFYTLAYEDEHGNLEYSPVNDSPLSLFDAEKHGEKLFKQYGIPEARLKVIPSPWVVDKLKALNGNIARFKVVKRYPSVLTQLGISKTEPGDDNNQDISALVGKVDIRKLEEFKQDDPNAYSFSGGLCRANQGLMEFVEMFKAPIKVLHPLLTATQEGNFKGTEDIGAIPFEGVIIAHSNESEWKAFSTNKKNEAFLDRVCVIKVPYCLSYTEELKIYEKLLRASEISGAPCAPETLRMLARFSVLTRLQAPADGSPLKSKLAIYNGDDVRATDPKAKPLNEYRDAAGTDEGMAGFSTRAGFKVLSKVFNFKAAEGGEIAANPIHLLYVLEKTVDKGDFSDDDKKKFLSIIKDILTPEYLEYIEKEIKLAYVESSDEFGQNVFDRYVTYADYWIQDQEYRDTDTGEMLDRKALNAELEKIEKPAGIGNPKDFRNEVVNFVLRARSNNGGSNPQWTAYEKMRSVIQKKIFANMEELLPVISFAHTRTTAQQDAHEKYITRMQKAGYTVPQIRLLAEWYQRSSPKP